MYTLLLFLGLLLVNALKSQAQTLPVHRSVDWTLAGLRPDTLTGLPIFDMQSLGAVGDGLTSNDAVISNFVATYFGAGAILEFPKGQFLFNQSIHLPNNFILRGQGADSTTFLMDLGGSGHGIAVEGNSTTDTTALLVTALKDSQQLILGDASSFAAGDWIQLKQDDNDWITSSWAAYQTGQVVQIDRMLGDTVWLSSPLRMDYDTARHAFLQKIIPQKNIGIECLKIKRLDDTAPQQGCNIRFKYAVNCWVKGVESEFCTFAHVKGEQSSNLYIAQSYFHHGFDYGGGGRAYGVVFQHATGECLAENNVFEHLRHSMLVQSGANGNVFAYNYSFDPYWSTAPNDAAGDIVLHGNYVYANLFEQNVCQNIVIDNSHGPNGPYNTFFRNRAEGFGIFFSASNSPNQNFLGNDITNTGFPYSFVNYSIQGTGHFIHGNNDKGTIKPTGTQQLMDSTYAYKSQPDFVPNHQWAKVGTPNLAGQYAVPALDRYLGNALFMGSCGLDLFMNRRAVVDHPIGRLFPNPSRGILYVESEKKIENVYICNELGQVVQVFGEPQGGAVIDLSPLRPAVYTVFLAFADGTLGLHKVVLLVD